MDDDITEVMEIIELDPSEVELIENDLSAQKEAEELEWQRRLARMAQQRLEKVAKQLIANVSFRAREEGTSLVLMLDRMIALVQEGKC